MERERERKAGEKEERRGERGEGKEGEEGEGRDDRCGVITVYFQTKKIQVASSVSLQEEGRHRKGHWRPAERRALGCLVSNGKSNISVMDIRKRGREEEEGRNRKGVGGRE